MIRIVTDSTSDLPLEECRKRGIEQVALSVHFGSESFRDGVDITHAEFYRRLSAAEELPTTSQLNPDDLVKVFEKHRAQGDEVVGIFLSSDLSGTYQSACIARDMAGGEGIWLVDSRSVTFGLGLLVMYAAVLRDGGMGAQELAAELEECTQRLRILAVVDTLKYLKMGGRISSAAAMVGGILGVSPIITVEDGKVEAAGKTRGRKAAFRWMEQKMQEQGVDETLPVAFGHTNCAEAMNECMEHFSALREKAPFVLTGSIGSVVGTHAGPGAAGVAYFTKKQP